LATVEQNIEQVITSHRKSTSMKLQILIFHKDFADGAELFKNGMMANVWKS